MTDLDLNFRFVTRTIATVRLAVLTVLAEIVKEKSAKCGYIECFDWLESAWYIDILEDGHEIIVQYQNHHLLG